MSTSQHLTEKSTTTLNNKLLTCIIFPFSRTLKYIRVPRNDRDYFIKKALKYEYLFVDEIYFNNTEYYIEILTNYYHCFFLIIDISLQFIFPILF